MKEVREMKKIDGEREREKKRLGDTVKRGRWKKEERKKEGEEEGGRGRRERKKEGDEARLHSQQFAAVL